MRRYETIVIIDPDLSDEDRSSLFERLKEIISQKDGFLIMLDEWGSQKLAYEIRKKMRGFYIRLEYCGTGLVVAEIERFCQINDRIIKYMTVLLEEEANVEAIKAEMAKAEIKDEPSDSPQDDASESEQPEPPDAPEPEAIAEENEEPQTEKSNEEEDK